MISLSSLSLCLCPEAANKEKGGQHDRSDPWLFSPCLVLSLASPDPSNK